MPSAEIVAIGTELLLGEIPDSNTQVIARALRELGIDIFRTSIVGDNKERITSVVREAMERSEIIITTGGLGPTVDDPTRSALAQATNSELVFIPELWDHISSFFRKDGRIPGENQKRQAFIPKSAQVIENPVGTAPGFTIQTNRNVIFSIPGVPSEMKFLLENSILPFLKDHYNLQEILIVHVLHTSGVGEGWIDEKIGDLEVLTNPTVGLSAHSGIVDIRIAVKAKNPHEAKSQILEVEKEIHKRLGDHIFGSNSDTLEKKVFEVVTSFGWSMYSIEYGTNGLLNDRLSALKSNSYLGGKQIDLNDRIISDLVVDFKRRNKIDVVIGLSIKLIDNSNQIDLAIKTPNKLYEHKVNYTGSSQNAPEFGVNYILDFIRRKVTS